jgi:hypothetical protein
MLISYSMESGVPEVPANVLDPATVDEDDADPPVQKDRKRKGKKDKRGRNITVACNSHDLLIGFRS